jgi:2-oxo-4-hydroxy-4-carboxy--5-ureidoimidazoline (OHCU) decarboxylase
MRDLPRQLSEDELAELFEGRTRLVGRLAGCEDPLRAADRIVGELSDDELKEALDAHPAIGAAPAQLSERSAAEQADEADPETLAELERLNREYEQRFGFRFVAFVNRRPKAQVLEELRERIERPREEELRRAARELVAIARDRWTRG